MRYINQKPTITKDQCQAWVDALRSGEYLQGTGALRKDEPIKAYCCIGVLAELLGTISEGPLLRSTVIAPTPLIETPLTLGTFSDALSSGLSWERKLAKMNDTYITFYEIADVIERRVLPECL
jgi:hypothetical protein